LTRKKKEPEHVYRAKKRAVEMLLEETPMYRIMEETGLNASVVGGLAGSLRSGMRAALLSKYGLAQAQETGSDEGSGEDEGGSIEVETPAPAPAPRGPGPLSIDLGLENLGVGPPPPPAAPGSELGPTESVIEVAGIPVGKKIRLTPKNLTLFDWFKARYGYEGGLSDFINDAIEDFFRSRGYTVKIVKEEEVH